MCKCKKHSLSALAAVCAVSILSAMRFTLHCIAATAFANISMLNSESVQFMKTDRYCAELMKHTPHFLLNYFQ
ncbi:hypothetical protein CXB77_11390 [Chromatium okenii]|uniref:Secreted protein n=1 Tax=Chromatium okenii TaxID=61644 RepID=A0A2S7XSD7_9GAMM|nr:hypothetical protein CXB77_11390 [Chromatium okenii]